MQMKHGVWMHSGNIWQWFSGKWTQDATLNNMKMLDVGSDGTVWGVQTTGTLFGRNVSNGQWEQQKGTYLNVSVKDANTIVAVDTNLNVLTGTCICNAFGE